MITWSTEGERRERWSRLPFLFATHRPTVCTVCGWHFAGWCCCSWVRHWRRFVLMCECVLVLSFCKHFTVFALTTVWFECCWLVRSWAAFVDLVSLFTLLSPNDLATFSGGFVAVSDDVIHPHHEILKVWKTEFHWPEGRGGFSGSSNSSSVCSRYRRQWHIAMTHWVVILGGLLYWFSLCQSLSLPFIIRLFRSSLWQFRVCCGLLFQLFGGCWLLSRVLASSPDSNHVNDNPERSTTWSTSTPKKQTLATNFLHVWHRLQLLLLLLSLFSTLDLTFAELSKRSLRQTLRT